MSVKKYVLPFREDADRRHPHRGTVAQAPSYQGDQVRPIDQAGGTG